MIAAIRAAASVTAVVKRSAPFDGDLEAVGLASAGD
jgi:hypothetical protein